MTGAADDCPTDVHLDRWKNGDEAAFAAIHAEVTPRLRSRILQSPSWPLLERHYQVDDVLQDFWMHAVPAAHDRFVHIGPGSLLGFLGEILDRKIVDLVRRVTAQKRGNGAVDRLATGFDAPDRGGLLRAAPETPTGKARFSEFVERARGLLPPDDFDVWYRIEILSHSSDEVAASVGRTDSAVRGTLMRSRAKIAAALAQGDMRT